MKTLKFSGAALLAVVIGVLSYLWSGNAMLGYVIGAAMIINLGMAGFSGLVIINITAILLMMSLIIMKQIETWRGNAMVWIVCGALLLLTLFEIAQIQ